MSVILSDGCEFDPVTDEVRRWVVETPRDSRKGERASKHLIEWIRTNGGGIAQYVSAGPLAQATGQKPLIGVPTGTGGQAWMAPGDYLIHHGHGLFTVTQDDPRR